MLADAPAARREVPAAHGLGCALERGAHRIVPAVEKAEQRDDAQDLDDLVVAPMGVQRPGDGRIDGVGHARRRQGELERRLLGEQETLPEESLPEDGEGETVDLGAEAVLAVAGGDEVQPEVSTS